MWIIILKGEIRFAFSDKFIFIIFANIYIVSSKLVESHLSHREFLLV